MDLYAIPKRKTIDWTEAPYHDEQWGERRHEIAYLFNDETTTAAVTKVVGKIAKAPLINYKPTGKIVVHIARYATKGFFGVHKNVALFTVGQVSGQIPAAIEPSVEREFQYHSEKWARETAHISSATELILHPSYQRIIGLGPAVLPYIFRDLVVQPKDWFWALHAITGESPVAPEDAGNMRRMTDAWARWGRDHQFT